MDRRRQNPCSGHVEGQTYVVVLWRLCGQPICSLWLRVSCDCWLWSVCVLWMCSMCMRLAWKIVSDCHWHKQHQMLGGHSAHGISEAAVAVAVQMAQSFKLDIRQAACRQCCGCAKCADHNRSVRERVMSASCSI